MNLTGWLVAPQPRTRRLRAQQCSRSGHKRARFCSFVIYSSTVPSCFLRCLLPSTALKSSRESGCQGVQISSIKGLRVSLDSGFLSRIDRFLGNVAGEVERNLTLEL